jgi:V8-like Glu-specific endopeptidase
LRYPLLRGLVAIAAGLLLGLIAAAPPPAQATEPVTSSVEESAQEVREYWTPRRMRNAEPAQPELRPRSGPRDGGSAPPRGRPLQVDPSPATDHRLPGLEAETLRGEPQPQHHATVNRTEVGDPGAEPFRAHGKVFFTLGGTDYVCSGTSVTSNNRSAVWTAGHCVQDRELGGFATKWAFVPAYRNGNAPFGRWPARRLAVTPQWRQESSFKYDLGAAVVRTNRHGESLGEVVGARGIAFNQPRRQQYSVFGYPAELPFDGRRLYRCDGPYGGSDNPGGPGPLTMFVACDQNGGSSGGGWVASGRVLSVISYKYLTEACVPLLPCRDHVYGPYQEFAAQRLYREVRGEPERCQGRRVTHLGTRRDDVIVGTPGPDVIKALAGDDVIRARGGRDRVCAGPGDDIVRGGRGNDRLRGGPGDDLLVGGKGRRDFCDGGSGRDRARGCERTRRIP